MGDGGLRDELERLARLHPSPIVQWECRDGGGAVHVELAAWALDVAADLARDFGPRVELVVGFLRYPGQRRFAYPGAPLRPPQHYPTVDPDEIEIDLRSSLVVPSGADGWATVGIENRSAEAITLVTNGHVSGRVVDHRGEGVGGSTHVEQAHRVDVRIAPHESHPVPLSVGTASIDPALGYAVPPGRWDVDFLLHLDDGRLLRSPPLPLTVT